MVIQGKEFLYRSSHSLQGQTIIIGPAALPLRKGIKLWDTLEEMSMTALQYVNHRFLEYRQKSPIAARKTIPVKRID